MARIFATACIDNTLLGIGGIRADQNIPTPGKPRRSVRNPLCLGAAILLGLLFCAAVVSGCGGSSHPRNTANAAAAAGSPIQHVVIIMQENRTFDNLFHGFPGADSANAGMSHGVKVPLTPIALSDPHDLGHTHTDWWQDWDNGLMDGFSRNGSTIPYSYVPSSQIQPYWAMAQEYALGDRMFQSNTGPTFPAHQYMIAGQSAGADEDPSNPRWGCDSPLGTTVALIGPNGTDLPGVFPCFDYKTAADLLDAAGISWHYYAPTSQAPSSMYSAYEAIRHIFDGKDWSKDVISPPTQVLTDVANGQLAQVTWICPESSFSDHPGTATATGPGWVASVVNAIGASSFWSSTAIFITWDDWGGWYDHVLPPVVDNMRLGFRVPVIVVSPYAKQGYVSHQVVETASLLTFVENNFGLGNLGQRDTSAVGFTDFLDYNQKPLAFRTIPTGTPPSAGP